MDECCNNDKCTEEAEKLLAFFKQREMSQVKAVCCMTRVLAAILVTWENIDNLPVIDGIDAVMLMIEDHCTVIIENGKQRDMTAN